MNGLIPSCVIGGLAGFWLFAATPALALDPDAEDAAACVGHYSAVAQAEILVGGSDGARGLEPADAELWRRIVRAARGTASDDELLEKAAESARNSLPYAMGFLNGQTEVTVDATTGPKNPDDYLTAMGKFCWNIEQRFAPSE
ncbi:MAG: hypothetical protein ACRCSU_08790 [Paracoccaceae bacterium]